MRVLVVLLPLLTACGPTNIIYYPTSHAASPASSEPSADEPAPSTDGATPSTPAEPATAPATPGPGAHCLHVGPKAVAVRCYWKREECDGQVAYNTEQGLAGSRCEAIPTVHCFQIEKLGERCYTTAHDCATHQNGMKKVGRITVACTAKTGP